MPTDVQSLARQTAEEFNSRHGGTWLRLAYPETAVTVGELRTLAQTRPGPYMAANIFLMAKGRHPEPGEIIRTGRFLSALGIDRYKDGPVTLWVLDAATAQRLS